MPYTGPFDEAYFDHGAVGEALARPAGYTDYADINPAIAPNVADDIEAELGLVSGKRVLEVGCAYGFLTNELASRGAIITGIDISAFAIAKAQALFPLLDFQVQDIRNTAFGPNTFDFIVTAGVVDCFADSADLRTAIREGKKIMKRRNQGGKAYFLTMTTGPFYFHLTEAQWQAEMETQFQGWAVTVTHVGHLPVAYEVRVVAV